MSFMGFYGDRPGPHGADYKVGFAGCCSPGVGEGNWEGKVMRSPAEGKAREPGEEGRCLWHLSEGDPPICTVTVIT